MVSCLLFFVAVDLISVFISALIILKIFSINQIIENQNWEQRLRGIIQTGNTKKMFPMKLFVYSGTEQ